MNVKIGEKYQIHCYKHNGKLSSISDEAIILDDTKEFLVCANKEAKLTDYDGNSHKTKEPAIIFFYKDNWFNVIAQFKEFGLFYYCNIATPYIIDEKTIKYIDYDLDLRVFPDGGYKILDRNEYKYHKKIMGYSNELDFVIHSELSTLIKKLENKKGPFDRNLLNEYVEKFKKLNN